MFDETARQKLGLIKVKQHGREKRGFESFFPTKLHHILQMKRWKLTWEWYQAQEWEAEKDFEKRFLSLDTWYLGWVVVNQLCPKYNWCWNMLKSTHHSTHIIFSIVELIINIHSQASKPNALEFCSTCAQDTSLWWRARDLGVAEIAAVNCWSVESFDGNGKGFAWCYFVWRLIGGHIPKNNLPVGLFFARISPSGSDETSIDF